MGQRRWAACAQMASDYLRRRHVAGVFLLRGLCLSRSEGVSAARRDYQNAATLLEMDPGLLQQILDLTEKRSGPGPGAPANKAAYASLMSAMMQRGVLDRLFVQQLLGRFETSLAVGSLEFGTLNNDEIRKVILSRSRSYRQCYAMARARRPWRPVLRGDVTMEFLINPVGRVTNVEVAQDGWQEHHARGFINDCITEQLEALRFPMPRYAMGHRAQHRFVFSD